MQALFERFTIEMTKDQAATASHQGDCEAEVMVLVASPTIQKQLKAIPDSVLVAELFSYGAWDPYELLDRKLNERRIIWIAANNITEDLQAR